MLHATSGGDRYGPRYYIETYPYFVSTIAAADVFRQQSGTRCCRIAAGAILSHLTALGVNLVMLLYFMRPIIDGRMDLYDQVARNRLDNAVVIIRSSPGSADSLEPLDLTRNGVELGGPVICALDPVQKLPAVKSMFPNRKFFVYDRTQGAPSGTLTPLD
jgi:hypothetical protein